MAYSFSILLLMTIASVQGHLNSDLNGTSSNSFDYKSISSEDHLRKQFKRKEFDNAFNHYRSDNRRREPRFISFESKKDKIHVEFFFEMPFLSIPVGKKSVSGVLGTLHNVMRGISNVNINAGAILLPSFAIAGVALIGGISRLLKPNDGSFVESSEDDVPSQETEDKKFKHVGDDGKLTQWWKIISQMNNALLKYDLDFKACSQRVICWHVKESLVNVEENKASKFDHIINGLTSSDWAMQFLNTSRNFQAWNQAVTTARTGHNCEATFSFCKLNSKYLEGYTQKVLEYVDGN